MKRKPFLIASDLNFIGKRFIVNDTTITEPAPHDPVLTVYNLISAPNNRISSVTLLIRE